MSSKRPCVYILASRRNGTLYVGVTSDLARRAWEHRSDAVAGFTQKYGVHTLVYAEFHDTMADAILREKRIEQWRRAWKLALIERANPGGATSMPICRCSGPLGSRFRGDEGNGMGQVVTLP